MGKLDMAEIADRAVREAMQRNHVLIAEIVNRLADESGVIVHGGPTRERGPADGAIDPQRSGGRVTSQCVVHSKPAEARHGLLCIAHFDRLADMLREVEEEAAILSAVPSMAIRTGSGGGSLASTRAPARLDVLVHRDTRRGTGKSETDDDQLAAGQTLPILDVLHSWARVVREERALTSPESVTVSGERDTLTRSLDWIAEQPWIDEMFTEVRQLVGQLKAANGHRADRPYSHCPTVVNGHNCTGEVWLRDEVQAVWRVYTDRCAQNWEPAPGAAVCDTCGSTWITDGDKARLKRMVDDLAADLSRPRTEDGRRMLTAEEMCAKLKIKPGTFRVRVHRAGVESVDGHYDPDLFQRNAVA